jgi:CheY-like chemotaxis protein
MHDPHPKIKVLAVDDEEMNIDVLDEHLKEAGYHVIIARDGVEAMKCLDEHPDTSIIVLDRMMPRMDGMEVIRLVKQDDKLKNIPIIMQTAAASSAQIIEGLQADVYYYLTKPYSIFKLVSIVRSALHHTLDQEKLRTEVREFKGKLGLVANARFEMQFKTLADARNLARDIAKCCPEPEKIVLGLNELLINAIEHGNLGITYAEKKLLVVANKWENEIAERLAKDEYKDKSATLICETQDNDIVITIKDEGKGFNWQTYLEIIPARMSEPHGYSYGT